MDYKIMGARIRSRRQGKNLTQAELADLAQVTPPFIGHIERGTRKASLETVCNIADALECSVDELVGRCFTPPEIDPNISDIFDRIMRLKTR